MEKLYHFTSFDTALKIIESNRLRFGRMNNMNDIHENDKIVFVDANKKIFDKFSSEELDSLHDEIFKYRQISLIADNKEDDKDGFDLHQMWGLYADKGEGVCLVFDNKELKKGFDIGVLNKRVPYDETVKSYYVSLSNNPDKVEKIEKARNMGEAGNIYVLVYGNGLFDYSLFTEDGKQELWNSEEGYDVLILGENCELYK